MPKIKPDNSPEIQYMFYKTKLKLIQFVMLLYLFTEMNIQNTQKRNKAFLPHKNKDYELSSCGHYYKTGSWLV